MQSEKEKVCSIPGKEQVKRFLYSQPPFPPNTFPRALMAARHFSAALLSAALPLVEVGLSRNKRVTSSCPVSHKWQVVVAGTKSKWKYVPRIRKPGRTSLQPLIGDNRGHGFFRKRPTDCDVLQGLTNISADEALLGSPQCGSNTRPTAIVHKSIPIVAIPFWAVFWVNSCLHCPETQQPCHLRGR